MLPNTPERLSRWMLLHEQPERLRLEHEAQIDLAWAADEIATLKSVIQMCFDDSCSQSGKIKKKTALELIKHADTRA